MGHGPYNGSASMHAPMGHGSYNSVHTPWPMDRAMVHIPHDPWLVQQYAYPMTHESCNSMHTPWVMDRTVVELGWASHGSWTVQWFS